MALSRKKSFLTILETSSDAMSILKDLKELETEGIISPEVARDIDSYYRNKSSQKRSTVVLVFGILGAILVGLGIILILAHNWDEFSNSVKLGLAFLPLITGQAVLGYSLWIRKSRTWQEGASGFLLLAVGACTALISQIYHIGGDLEQFMLVWILLTLPILYIASSGAAFLLLMCGITFYGCLAGYDRESTWYYYWLLLGSLMPFYFQRTKNQANSNSTHLFHWAIALSVIVVLGAVPANESQLLLICYTGLFACYYLIGSGYLSSRYNAFQVSGIAGLVILVLILSYGDPWINLKPQVITGADLPTLIACALLTLTGIILLVLRLSKTDPFSFVFLVILLLFFLAGWVSFAPLLINLMVLGLGIWTLRKGIRENHLVLVNGGLLLIAVLIMCRFFDRDFSFVVRGISFVLIGAGFFVANYVMIKKKAGND